MISLLVNTGFPAQLFLGIAAKLVDHHKLLPLHQKKTVLLSPAFFTVAFTKCNRQSTKFAICVITIIYIVGTPSVWDYYFMNLITVTRHPYIAIALLWVSNYM